MVEFGRLQQSCWQALKKYEELDIYGNKICAPYFINSVEAVWVELLKEAGISELKIAEITKLYHRESVLFGRYRGKGTPEQLQKATIEISEEVGLPLKNSGPAEILDFMKLRGIGIDCSGFVYNVFNHAFNEEGEPTLLDSGLMFTDKTSRGVYRAGAGTFAGDASILIRPKDIRPLDLILIKSSRKKDTYIHIALVLGNKNNLSLAQSTISASPAGVNVNRLSLENNSLKFDFTPKIGSPWEELYKVNRLEIRRLKILEQITG